MAQGSDELGLVEQAHRLGNALRTHSYGKRLQFEQNVQAISYPHTDGWYVLLAKMGPRLPEVGLTLDRWAGEGERCFWFGFWSSSPKPVERIMENLPAHLKIGRAVTSKDTKQDGERWYLKRPLSKKDAGFPIHELYGGDSYFGIYDLEHRGRTPPLNLDSAFDFFGQVISSLQGFRDSFDLDCDLEAVPIERRRREYSISTRLARQFIRKRVLLGTLNCDYCRFDPSTQVNGLSINPRSLLDIHHNNPRALGGKRWTKLCDLTLLCPTCHRVVHAKMRAEPNS